MTSGQEDLEFFHSFDLHRSVFIPLNSNGLISIGMDDKEVNAKHRTISEI